MKEDWKYDAVTIAGIILYVVAAVCVIVNQSASGADLPGLVSQAWASNRNSPAEISAWLREPVPVETNVVQVAKSQEVLAWELATQAEIADFVETITGVRSNAVKRVGALSSTQMLAVVRAAKSRGGAEQRQRATDQTDALVLLYLDAVQRGYSWPLPDHFGQPTYPATNIVFRARWQVHQGTNDFPTIQQIQENL